MSFWKWSRTAATNASADATVNWAEGMPPGQVNDSGRAMMAAAAKYRDDMAGAIVTSGSSTAYTVASYQVFDTLAHLDGNRIAFTPHTTNGAAPTLNVDGLGNVPIRSAPGVSLPAGVLVQGSPYTVLYSNANGELYLEQFFGSGVVIPIGGLIDYCGTTAPNSSFVLPAGQAISRTTYATLFALIGTTFGVGDGSTTFNVPDLRGRMVAALDNLNGSAASRIGTVVTDNGTITGTSLGSTGGQATHSQTLAEMATYTPAGTIVTTTGVDTEILVTSGAKQVPSTGAQFFDSTVAGVTLTSTFTGATHTQSAATVVLPPTMMLGKILRVL